MTNTGGTPAGWYHAAGDPDGTQRYWDGAQWIGDPQPVPQQAAPTAPSAPTPTPQNTQDDLDAGPPASSDPADGDRDADPGAQAPSYGAPPSSGDQQPPASAGSPGSDQQAPSYGAPPQTQPSPNERPAGQQPPAYGGPPSGQGSPQGGPPPGSSAPPGYQAYGTPGAAQQSTGLAEGWKRLVARFIDGIIVGIASFIVGIVIAVAVDNILGTIIAGVLGIAISVAYEVLLTTNVGATVGKKIFNMRIVNEGDRSKVDQQVMIKRMIPIIAIGLLGVIPILGLLAIPLQLAFVILSLVWIFTDDRRRSVYDRFGNTVVIEE